MLGQGFVKSYGALAVCRTLLGFFEAGELRPSLLPQVKGEG
jgi:hypothetical protein